MELHKLENYDLDFINSLINNNIEESINIDFKSADALSKVDSKKKEISKDVSAFANSNGGIIIYGVDEINHKASAISFVDGNEFTKEWLEQVISSTIQRNIPDLKIFPIRKDAQINQTVYVVQIPESVEAPHICKDKKFYKRYNFESVAMEEYEVRSLYGRTSRSKLIIGGYSIAFKEITNDFIVFSCRASVHNDGDKVEKDYKINTYFINACIGFQIRPQNYSTKEYHYTKLEEKRFKITSQSNTSLYPNETIDLIDFDFEVPKNLIETAFENLKIEFRLYYTDGEDLLEANSMKNFYEKIKLTI
jgi:hypothetical protein